MADRFTTEKRREIMSKVGGKNTTPELTVRRLLHRLGYRFRLHRRDLPGTPDIVLPRYKTVISVHGCFWHGHEGCRKGKLPATRQQFWREKIDANKQRDVKVASALAELGYRTLVVWECELKSESEVIRKIEKILKRE